MSAAVRPAPLHPRESPPDDAYCDLVLKGGVVDGVVYPWAIMELARAYRFRNISGTSVGAVAAALTAAAEYSRRYGSDAGFNEVLLKLPEELAERHGKDTKLFTLFQPAPGGCRRLFTVFVALFGQDSTATAVWLAYGRPALLALLVAMNAVMWIFGVSLAQALVDGLVVGAATLGWMLYADVRALADDGFGLCSGQRLDASPQGLPAFTDWLHEGIQAAAQRPLNQPLTFRHLWEAPGGTPGGAAVSPLARRSRSIDLRMISTSLSHGRPYGLPLGDDGSRLFFKLAELAPYFPDAVMAHLRRTAVPYQRLPGDPPIVLPPGAGSVHDYLQLPQGDLPVLVATRMSLSFPVLFKAVPLYAIDSDAPGGPGTLRRCWFADGGICSNFMIHQFDAILPKWPTFGIALEADRDLRARRPPSAPAVVVTRRHGEGREEVWNRFDPGPGGGPPVPPMSRFVGFLVSLLDATKDWNDNTSMRMSGTRDRIARIRLSGTGEPGLGGLNLRLSGTQILRMARDFGWPAGRMLVEKFSPARSGASQGGEAASASWSEHRWVRFQSFVHGLRERIAGFELASERAGYSLPLSRQIALARQAPPLAGPDEAALTEAQARALEATRQALVALEASFAAAPTVQPYQPMPPPEMRLRMPL